MMQNTEKRVALKNYDEKRLLVSIEIKAKKPQKKSIRKLKNKS